MFLSRDAPDAGKLPKIPFCGHNSLGDHCLQMDLTLKRVVKAVLHAMGAFLVAGLGSCIAFTAAVSGSHDGQAGMGAAFGGFYVGCIAMIVTFIVSLVKSSRVADRDKSTH
jgi:hypothetical protein